MATTTTVQADSTVDNVLKAVGLVTDKSNLTTTVNSGGTTTQTQNDSGHVDGQFGSTTVNNSGRTDTSETYNSGRTDTQQLMLSDSAVQGMINHVLESAGGLADIASGSHISGIYNATSQSQMSNDLISRATVDAEAKRAPLVTHIGPSSSSTTSNIGASSNTTNYNTYNQTGARSVVTTTDVPQTTTVTNSTAKAPVSLTTAAAATAGTAIAGKVWDAAKNAWVDANAAGTPIVVDTAGAAVNSTGTSVAGQVTNAGIDADYYGAGAGAVADTATTGTVADTIATGLTEGGVEAVGYDAATTAALESAGYEVGTSAMFTGVGAELAGDAVGALAVEEGIGAAAEGAGMWETVAAAVAAWIICTELNKQGRLPTRWYIPGARAFAAYDEQGKKGYYIWAVPSVRHLRRNPGSLYSKFLEVWFNARAEYLAAKAGIKGARKTLFGWTTVHSTYWFCWTLSRTIARNYNTPAELIALTTGVTHGR